MQSSEEKAVRRRTRKTYVPIRQAAREISVSEQHIRKLIADGLIPFIRPTQRTTRVALDDLKSVMFERK